MKKKKGRKAFWHNIKFKYKLTIINENTLEEVVGLHVSKLNGFSVLLSMCCFIFLVAASIIAFTPLRNYLPGYMNSEVREQVVMNALRADSLQLALDRQKRYIMNVQDIIGGKVKVDTVKSIDSLTNVRVDELLERSKEEEEFIQKYEETERYNLRNIGGERELGGLIFYRPTRGLMSADFNPGKKQYGVKLTANPNESVLAVLDGTVVFAAYTAETGYVVQIQHSQNFVSIYKHCGTLMKHQGDKVKGGDVIALIGKEHKEKPQLYFELWHKGTPVNPGKYVVF